MLILEPDKIGMLKPKIGSWPSRNPSTAAEAEALRANGLSPNG